jgi:hypothetical protein
MGIRIPNTISWSFLHQKKQKYFKIICLF